MELKKVSTDADEDSNDSLDEQGPIDSEKATINRSAVHVFSLVVSSQCISLVSDSFSYMYCLVYFFFFILVLFCFVNAAMVMSEGKNWKSGSKYAQDVKFVMFLWDKKKPK